MKSVRHTGIIVKELESALHFYRDLLKLSVVKIMEESGEYIEKVLGLKGVKVTTVKLAAENGSLVELLHYASPAAQSEANSNIHRTGISHIAFTVKDLSKKYEELLKAGVEFKSIPEISPNGYVKVAFCQDPDGCLIELVEECK